MRIPRPHFPSLLLLLVFLATAARTISAPVWRSTLYPEDWQPGFADTEGRFLHDFSMAGYHHGDRPVPDITGNVIDVTRPPYDADSSGLTDSTVAIQRALDDAGQGGGAVVYLPPGTYRVSPREGEKSALRVRDDNVVLRGAGKTRTFLFNDSEQMREKHVVDVSPRSPVSWNADGRDHPGIPLSADAPGPTRTLPVADVSPFSVGQLIVVRNDLTQHYIDTIGMRGKWTPGQSMNRTLAYCRRITSIDTAARALTLDIPVRGFLFRADNARVVTPVGNMLSEVGLEDFSIGMRECSGEGLEESDFSKAGTVGYAVHGSVALRLGFVENGWVRRVATYAPPGNVAGSHVQSNCLKLWRTRLVTVSDCDFKFPQYRGGGGNGYLYALNGQDNLIRDCRAEGARHNYDFGTMSASGNVILDCLAKDGKLGSDFHMFFSLANLLDNVTCDGDFLEARAIRPFGGNPIHGVTTTQSVFWNTIGRRYSEERRVLVYSRQFGDGYVIGTRGPAHEVDTDDFAEGIGAGGTLEPRSLYLDQFARRQRAGDPVSKR